MFKVGDKVKCISSTHCLKKDKIYVVTECDDLYVVVDHGVDSMALKDGGGWYHDRFELVKEEAVFKAGDKVLCVGNAGVSVLGLIESGNRYTVESVDSHGNLYIWGVPYSWSPNYFVLDEDNKSEENPMLKIEVGKTYVTRDRHKVRIVCTDVKNQYCVLGLVDIDGTEETASYFTRGGRMMLDGRECSNDLVSEYEEPKAEWLVRYKNGTYSSSIFYKEEEARESIEDIKGAMVHKLVVA